MKKAVLLVVSVFLLSIMLAGCGGKSQQTGDAGKAKESFPTGPIEYVVHTNPGDGADIAARTIADIAVKKNIVSQPVNVVNKVGGSGSAMFSYVATKKGNGHFIMPMQVSGLTTPLRTKTEVTYKDFTPIALMTKDELVIAVKAESQFKSMKDLVAAAKKGEKSVSQGGGVLGGSDSILSFLIEKSAGVKFNYITFKGGGEAVVALLGGNCDFIAMNPAEVEAQVEAGKMRLLAVASSKRLEKHPNVPTLKEEGVDVVLQSFRGVAAPKDISGDAKKYLEEAMKKVAETDEFKAYCKQNSVTLEYMNSADFAKYLDQQNEMFTAVYKDMGLLK